MNHKHAHVRVHTHTLFKWFGTFHKSIVKGHCKTRDIISESNEMKECIVHIEICKQFSAEKYKV